MLLKLNKCSSFEAEVEDLGHSMTLEMLLVAKKTRRSSQKLRFQEALHG